MNKSSFITMLSSDELREHEANMFALTLLIPANRLLYEIRKEPIDLSDEHSTRMNDIAKLFGVSLNAIIFRLLYLKNKK